MFVRTELFFTFFFVCGLPTESVFSQSCVLLTVLPFLRFIKLALFIMCATDFLLLFIRHSSSDEVLVSTVAHTFDTHLSTPCGKCDDRQTQIVLLCLEILGKSLSLGVHCSHDTQSGVCGEVMRKEVLILKLRPLCVPVT